MDESVRAMGVLDKAVALLAALEHGPLGLADLVSATGFPRATAHRLAVTLEGHGLVRRDLTGRFALGARLVALGRVAADGFGLRQAARPALERLRSATGESVQLYVRESDRRVCVESMQSPHELRTIVPVGAALPLDVGSAGKVLRGNVLSSGGWAESVAEREAGVASVSAPVRDGQGVMIAAVSVSGPIERVSRQPGLRYGAEVVAAAREIESAML